VNEEALGRLGAVAPKTNSVQSGYRPHPALSDAHSPGLKRSEFEADHSSASSAKFKNELICAIPPLLPGLRGKVF